jgi:nesprin-1
MNDAGNFLIETCDEIVSRDLKQQLLLLNGRWRELFMEVKQVCPSNQHSLLMRVPSVCSNLLTASFTAIIRVE